MKRKLVLIGLLIGSVLCMPAILKADDFQYALHIKEVKFQNDDERKPNFFPVRKDDNFELYIQNGQPHWQRGMNTKIPIAYQSGKKARVSVKFVMECGQNRPPSRSNIKIRGKGLDDSENVLIRFTAIRPTEINEIGSGTYEVICNNMRSEDVFILHKILYVEHFSTIWEVSFDGENSWADVQDKSENELFVTWQSPSPEFLDRSIFTQQPTYNASNTFLWTYTIFRLTCEFNNGLLHHSSSDVVNKNWSMFNLSDPSDNPHLVCKSSTPHRKLVYYKTWTTENLSAYTLIRDGDGQCYALNSLFIDINKIHGTDTMFSKNIVPIVPSGHEMFVDERMGKPIAFLVNNWQINEPTATSISSLFPLIVPYENQYHRVRVETRNNQRVLVSTIDNNRLDNLQIGLFINSGLAFTPIRDSEVRDIDDMEGAAGQNSSNPLSLFQNHNITQYEGKLYDPSYGRSYVNLQELKTQAISNFVLRDIKPESFVQKDINWDNIIDNTRFMMLFISKNNNATEMRFSN